MKTCFVASDSDVSGRKSESYSNMKIFNRNFVAYLIKREREARFPTRLLARRSVK